MDLIYIVSGWKKHAVNGLWFSGWNDKRHRFVTDPYPKVRLSGSRFKKYLAKTLLKPLYCDIPNDVGFLDVGKRLPVKLFPEAAQTVADIPAARAIREHCASKGRKGSNTGGSQPGRLHGKRPKPLVRRSLAGRPPVEWQNNRIRASNSVPLVREHVGRWIQVAILIDYRAGQEGRLRRRDQSAGHEGTRVRGTPAKTGP